MAARLVQTQVQLAAFDASKPTANLRIRQDAPVPSPARGEVLVKIATRPVNPADVMSLKGVYPGFQPKEFPAVPGLEGAGVVEEVGEGITDPPAVGTRGFFLANGTGGQGSWQQYAAVSADCFHPIPDTLELVNAANIYINGITAWGLLAVVDPQPGCWILQSAAASTLGRMIIQVAKLKGYRTVNVVRRQEQMAELTAIGADAVIWSDGPGAAVRGAVARDAGSPEELRELDTAGKDFLAVVKAVAGEAGAWGALDPVGGDSTLQLASATRNKGTVVVYGNLSSAVAHVRIPDLLFREVTLRGFWLGPWFASLGAEGGARLIGEIVEAFDKGHVATVVGKAFPLERVVEAVEESERPGRGGKVMLVG